MPRSRAADDAWSSNLSRLHSARFWGGACGHLYTRIALLRPLHDDLRAAARSTPSPFAAVSRRRSRLPSRSSTARLRRFLVPDAHRAGDAPVHAAHDEFTGQLFVGDPVALGEFVERG